MPGDAEVAPEGLFFNRAWNGRFQAFFGAMFQFILHTDVVFPNEIVELRGFDIHDHGRALKVLDEVAVIDMGQSLHEHLIEMLARLRFATLVQEQKILDLLGVGRLVREVLLHHHHGRKEQNGHHQECVTIPPKELHGVVFNRGCGLLQRTISDLRFGVADWKDDVWEGNNAVFNG